MHLRARLQLRIPRASGADLLLPPGLHGGGDVQLSQTQRPAQPERLSVRGCGDRGRQRHAVHLDGYQQGIRDRRGVRYHAASRRTVPVLPGIQPGNGAAVPGEQGKHRSDVQGIHGALRYGFDAARSLAERILRQLGHFLRLVALGERAARQALLGHDRRHGLYLPELLAPLPVHAQQSAHHVHRARGGLRRDLLPERGRLRDAGHQRQAHPDLPVFHRPDDEPACQGRDPNRQPRRGEGGLQGRYRGQRQLV